nr:tetratricopeptide repeat-containing serine protease family protein [uncultured Desulfobulbus sp.]
MAAAQRRLLKAWYTSWLLVGLVCLFGPTTIQAAQQAETVTSFAQISPSLVEIKATGPGAESRRGSGVVVRPYQVLTSSALITKESTIEVWAYGKRFASTPLVVDQARELCLLAVPELSAPPAQLGRAGSLAQQQSVWAVGATDATRKMEPAIVTQLRGTQGPLIETTLLAAENSLGRGVLNNQGQLIGITTVFTEGETPLYFTAPVEWLQGLQQGQGEDGPSRTLYWLKRASLAEKNNDWKELRAVGRHWADERPDNATAWHTLGYACIYLELRQEALEAFQQTVRIDPDDIDGWSNIGFAQSDLMHYAEAAQAYAQVVRLQPEDVEGWLNLSMASDAAGEHALAKKALEALAQLAPLKAAELRDYFAKKGSLPMDTSHPHD